MLPSAVSAASRLCLRRRSRSALPLSLLALSLFSSSASTTASASLLSRLGRPLSMASSSACAAHRALPRALYTPKQVGEGEPRQNRGKRGEKRERERGKQTERTVSPSLSPLRLFSRSPFVSAHSAAYARAHGGVAALHCAAHPCRASAPRSPTRCHCSLTHHGSPSSSQSPDPSVPRKVGDNEAAAAEAHGTDLSSLMQLAGAAAYKVIQQHFPDARHLAVLCGKVRSEGGLLRCHVQNAAPPCALSRRCGLLRARTGHAVAAGAGGARAEAPPVAQQ